MWPFTGGKSETRADSSYTDALVAAITANARGQNAAFPTATAALEACAGFVGAGVRLCRGQGAACARLCALAGMHGDDRAVALVRRGEVVFLHPRLGGRGVSPAVRESRH